MTHFVQYNRLCFCPTFSGKSPQRCETGAHYLFIHENCIVHWMRCRRMAFDWLAQKLQKMRHHFPVAHSSTMGQPFSTSSQAILHFNWARSSQCGAHSIVKMFHFAWGLQETTERPVINDAHSRTLSFPNNAPARTSQNDERILLF